MKLTLTDIGKLVRPKKLVDVAIYPFCYNTDVVSTKQLSPPSWYQERRNYKVASYNSIREFELSGQFKSAFNKDPEELFTKEKFNLGQLENLDSNNCYVAKIVGFVVYHGGNSHYINTEEAAKQLNTKIAKSLYHQKYYYISGVELEFYESCKKTINVSNNIPIYTTINLISLKHYNDHTVQIKMFYSAYDLVDFLELIKFEEIKMYDIIFFKRSLGVICRKTQATQTTNRFWKFNSLTLKKIHVLKKNKISVVQPNVFFRI